MDKEILDAITALTDTVNENFQAMRGTLTDIESRLGKQEAKSRKMEKRQRIQEKDIEELKKIVLDLAKNKPIKQHHNGVAISKEDAYQRFAGKGIGKVTATKALRDAGILVPDAEGKCTFTIWNNGGCLRVLLISQEEW